MYTLSCVAAISKPSAFVDMIDGSTNQSLTLNPNVNNINRFNQCDSSSNCNYFLSLQITLNDPIRSIICSAQNNTFPYNFTVAAKFYVNITGISPNNRELIKIY